MGSPSEGALMRGADLTNVDSWSMWASIIITQRLFVLWWVFFVVGLLPALILTNDKRENHHITLR